MCTEYFVMGPPFLHPVPWAPQVEMELLSVYLNEKISIVFGLIVADLNIIQDKPNNRMFISMNSHVYHL